MKPTTVADPSTAGSGNQGDQVRQRSHQHSREYQAGDGSKVLFFLSRKPRDESQLMVYVNGALYRPSERGVTQDYTYDGDSRVTFATAPASTDDICFAIIS